MLVFFSFSIDMKTNGVGRKKSDHATCFGGTLLDVKGIIIVFLWRNIILLDCSIMLIHFLHQLTTFKFLSS